MKSPKSFFSTFEPINNAPGSKIKTILLPGSVLGAYDALNGKHRHAVDLSVAKIVDMFVKGLTGTGVNKSTAGQTLKSLCGLVRVLWSYYDSLEPALYSYVVQTYRCRN